MNTGLMFLCLLAVAALCGAVSLPATAASPALPDTPAGRQMGALVAVVNTGDEAALHTFGVGHFSPAALGERAADDLVRYLRNVNRRAGRLEWDAVYPQSDTYIGGLAWGTHKPYRRPDGRKIFVRLEVLAQPPFLINQYEFRASDPPLDALLPYPKPGAPESARIRQIEEAASRAAAQDDLSGTLLIARNGKVLLEKSYGQADKALGVPNRPDTRYDLASVGKVFTTVAIAQLAAQRKLDYDTPILHYLPDYPNAAVAGKITLRHLLTHTSGLGDIFGPGKDGTGRRLRHLSDYLPSFAGEPLLFEPGKGHSYSNAGFVVLSLVVERVSGQSFGDYLQDHVFRPVGMGVDYGGVGALVPRRATGYIRGDGDDPLNPAPPWENNLPFLVSLGTGPANGAGGGCATAQDLLRFTEGLRSHKLLSAAALDTLLKNGLGFEVGSVNGHLRYGHTGDGPGMNASVSLVPDLGYVVICLSNYDPAFAQTFADRAGDLLTRK